MPEFNTNIWAPWRMEYIRSLAEDLTDDGCFLCHYWEQPPADVSNHVLWRTPCTMVVMNRFPYTNGHLLVAHSAHKAELSELNDEELTDLTRALRDGVGVLRAALAAQGFNIGYNLGRCAGAGLPGHLHAHIVPRWSGDTNFMAVLGETRVIPDGLDATYTELIKHVQAAGLA